MHAVLIALFSYLLGSLVAGILYSYARGEDIRGRDLPGGSGTYRQYGREAAIVVTLLDGLKGAAAVWLAHALAPQWTWLAVGGVVLGHCYPIFFGFRGGGGIATLLGALFVAAPLTTALMLGLGLAVIPLYKATWQKQLGLNAIPVATAVAVPLGLLLSTRFGGLYELLAGGGAMGLRALDMVQQDRIKKRRGQL